MLVNRTGSGRQKETQQDAREDVLQARPGPPPAAALELPGELIANVRVVKNRRELLRLVPSGGVAAEFGVAGGVFSAQILAENRPAKLHLIDPWDTARYGEAELARVRERLGDELAGGRAVLHRGYSLEVLPDFPDGYFDWVYIDTDHRYESTAAELSACRKKVAPGGLIAGHDYTTGNLGRGLRYGVIEAVNEFCVRYGWEMVYLTHEASRYLSYGLRERVP